MRGITVCSRRPCIPHSMWVPRGEVVRLTAPAPTLNSRRFEQVWSLLMAENPQSPPTRSRPLSPHLGIYKWPITMATSITHRATGVAISAGMILIAWGLIALASGPELYQPFTAALASLIGQVVLFGFLWALTYHFLNGIR